MLVPILDNPQSPALPQMPALPHTPSLTRTTDLLQRREEWRTRKDQCFILRQNACREEDDDNLAWFTREYEYALAQYRAACDALDLRN